MGELGRRMLVCFVRNGEMLGIRNEVGGEEMVLGGRNEVGMRQVLAYLHNVMIRWMRY